MPPQIHHHVPHDVRAGDTWEWLRIYHYFPVSDVPQWTMTCWVNGPSAGGGTGQIVASVYTDNVSWYFLQLPAVSVNYLPGTYQWSIKASRNNSGTPQEYEVENGVFTVVPNYQTLAPAKSYNQTTLEQIQAVLANRLAADVQDYTIGGRRMVKIPVLELVGLESIFKYRVAKERNPGRLAQVNKVSFKGGGLGARYDWD